MRVIARTVDRKTCPPDIEPYNRQIFITQGKEYEVHAMSVFKGMVSVLVSDDLEYASWVSIWFFDVLETSIPDDWICNFFHDEPSMVIGPEFMAKSIEAYSALTLHEPDPVWWFEKRIILRQRKDSEEP